MCKERLLCHTSGKRVDVNEGVPVAMNGSKLN
jgi:hypothetical protein